MAGFITPVSLQAGGLYAASSSTASSPSSSAVETAQQFQRDAIEQHQAEEAQSRREALSDNDGSVNFSV